MGNFMKKITGYFRVESGPCPNPRELCDNGYQADGAPCPRCAGSGVYFRVTLRNRNRKAA